MKITEPAEQYTGTTAMESGKPLTKGAKQVRSRRRASGLGLSPLPLEWMDAGTWRLPSGKALAEFALQAGFLAPLLLGAPLFSGNGTGETEGGTDGEGGARRVTVPPVAGGGQQTSRGRLGRE